MNTDRHHGFRLPAEWEPQSGVMLIWPHEDTDWRPYLKEITEVYLQMADAITRHEALLITARNTEQVRNLLAERLTEEQMRQVTLFACDSNDTWARDVAPISLVSDAQPKGSFQPTHLLDFCFNGWGGKFAAEKDNRINDNRLPNSRTPQSATHKRGYRQTAAPALPERGACRLAGSRSAGRR